MAVMPFVPETKMVDVGKLISLENLLVRKVMWFVLTTTSATLILSRALELTEWQRLPIYTLVFQELVEKGKISYFGLARNLIRHLISPNQDDLSYSARTFISGQKIG